MASKSILVAQFPSTHVSTHRATDAFRRREQRRVRRHFRDVLAELELAPAAGLTEGQRTARARTLEALAKYRRASRFPHNADFAWRRAPYFVDAQGTRCAVAHLMEQSGASSLMRRIARDQNNAYVRELSADAEVAAWLASVGLTLGEAARIQPDYCGLGTRAQVCCGSQSGSDALIGAVEGVVESLGEMNQVVVLVTSTYGTVTGVDEGRLTVLDRLNPLVVGDPVLVSFTMQGGPSVQRVDANDQVMAICSSRFFFPPTMHKQTLIAMAEGTACLDAIAAHEPSTWQEDAAPCSTTLAAQGAQSSTLQSSATRAAATRAATTARATSAAAGGANDGGAGDALVGGRGCGVGVDGIDASGAGVAVVVLAAASMRARWRGRRARRGHRDAR